MSGLASALVRKKTIWTPQLVTLELDAGGGPFAPGQFFNLGLVVDGQMVRRSYSAASAPHGQLEFFVSEVLGSGLSPQLCRLNEGDEVFVDKKPLGFFTLAEVPEASDLWLVATGTGLGPYISMLREGSLLARFSNVIVAHGVRQATQLAYRDELAALSAEHPQFHYVPILSGDSSPPAASLRGRITTAFQTGDLERAAQASFGEHSHMLLCGNPQMIDQMGELLKARGFEKHRRKKPGHFNFERYW